MAEAEARSLAELRRRMQGSFSAGELRELGASLGLSPAEAWEKGPESAVRDIVRRATDGPGLPVLVDELRRARPLVEWPDPLPARAGDTEGAAPASEIPDLDAPTIVDPASRPLDLTPPPMPAGEVATGDAPTAEPTAEPTDAAAPGSAASPLSARSEGPPSAAPSNPWPMANLREPEKKSGLDSRLLAIAIACVALAVGIAFVGGIVFSRRGEPTPSSKTVRSDTLAGHAANVMDGAIVEVARGCGLVVEGTPDRSVLKRAQAQCGHPVAAAGRPPPGYDPADIEPPKLDVPPANPKTQPITGPGGPPAPPADLCRAGCKTERRSCMTACGPEPRDAIDFDTFSQCQSKCLGAESTCRQRCP